VQELLAGTQELNRKTEEVSRNAADYGTLVLYITFATLLAGGLSTCAVSSELLRSVLRLDVTDILIIGNVLNVEMAATLQPHPHGGDHCR
jgi:hypothetical protein